MPAVLDVQPGPQPHPHRHPCNPPLLSNRHLPHVSDLLLLQSLMSNLALSRIRTGIAATRPCSLTAVLTTEFQ
jgi:hypothetical protein